MQINTTSAAIVMACASVVPWLGHQADKIVNEAPISWVRTAQSAAGRSSVARDAWRSATQDGIVTMAEVRAVEAAQVAFDMQQLAAERTIKPKSFTNDK